MFAVRSFSNHIRVPIYQSCFCPIALGVVGKKRAMGFSQAFDRVSNCGEMANVRVGEENADTSMGSSKN